MKTKKPLLWVFTIVAVISIVSCAGQPSPTAFNPPGFFGGIFHGFIILFSFVGSIFSDIRIYAFPNSGVMYDFGYLIGLVFWRLLI